MGNVKTDSYMYGQSRKTSKKRIRINRTGVTDDRKEKKTKAKFDHRCRRKVHVPHFAAGGGGGGGGGMHHSRW